MALVSHKRSGPIKRVSVKLKHKTDSKPSFVLIPYSHDTYNYYAAHIQRYILQFFLDTLQRFPLKYKTTHFKLAHKSVVV